MVATIVILTLLVLLLGWVSHRHRRHPGEMSAEEAGRDSGFSYRAGRTPLTPPRRVAHRRA